MIKFIHAADIHLDSPLHRLDAYEGAPVDNIRQATRRAFENLIDLAIAESVDFVLIAGDLFDGDWKDYHTGLYFTGQMHRLKAAEIPVFIISGNHDAAGQMTHSLPYPENVHLFPHKNPGTQLLDKGRIAIHGQSFAHAAVSDNLACTYPEPVPNYFNIGLLHTSLNGREGHETYAPCHLEDLQNRGYDYWALGHVHQHEIVSAHPPVVFSGCIQGRHIRERGTKGVVMVSFSEGAPPTIEHHPLDVIRWDQLVIDMEDIETEQACFDHFVATLQAEIQQNDPLPMVVRVLFAGETNLHTQLAGDPEYWREAVRSVALAHFGERVWIEKVIVATQSPERGATQSIDSGPLLELERIVAGTLADDDQLDRLGGELADLFRKLPLDYRRGAEAFDPANPECLRTIVEQAHALIVQGLKREGHGP